MFYINLKCLEAVIVIVHEPGWSDWITTNGCTMKDDWKDFSRHRDILDFIPGVNKSYLKCLFLNKQLAKILLFDDRYFLKNINKNHIFHWKFFKISCKKCPNV